MRKYIESISEYAKVCESSLSRIWQHIKKQGSFGIISPFRASLSLEDNNKRYAELKKAIRDTGYGFIEMLGGYDEQGTIVKEKSIFIPNVSKEHIMAWGKKYDQDSIIYKDDEIFQMIGTNSESGIGKILMDFKKNKGRENFNFDEETMKYVFSQLAKGSHKGKKFLLNANTSESLFLYELVDMSFNERAYGNGERKMIKLL